MRSADAQQSIQMARRSIVYIGEFFASGPPNTAPELPETPWYCRGTAGVLPAFKIVENGGKNDENREL